MSRRDIWAGVGLVLVGLALGPAASWACSCLSMEMWVLEAPSAMLIAAGDGVAPEDLDAAAEAAWWSDRAGIDALGFWTLGDREEVYISLDAVFR
ncbi:MAG: hypothetical protein AAFV53_33955 [Myxococcota bacterium]